MSAPRLRSATAADLPTIRRALYLSATWRGERPEWPEPRVLAHDYFRQFWEDWGNRTGDIGVIALVAGEPVGAAFGRRFTVQHHAHGFVDELTPEIAVGVEPTHRGRGVGTALLEELAAQARAAGMPALSLSVELENRAQRLYRRLGFVEIDRDEDAIRMKRSL